MMHKKKGIFIEVHRHIVNADDPCYFDISDFWARAQPVRKANAEALAFSPEDMIAHFAIKFLIDRRFQSDSALGQLCDISEIINHYRDSLDWDLLVREAREKKFASALYVAFYACRRILGTSVPAGPMQKLRPVQFDPRITDLFLRRRVLDTTRWLAHDLVDHQRPYSGTRVLGTVFSRFSRLLVDLFGRNGHEGRRRQIALKRIKTALPRLFRGLLKPSDLKEDVILDRWLHDLHRQT